MLDLQPTPLSSISLGAPGDAKTTDFSDLDLRYWKQYNDVLTDTLWLLGARDKSGAHVGDYWGNFPPQVASQVIRRFSKTGEVVVDFFSGMGTTLIECRRLGRHGIGVELATDVATRASTRVANADNPFDVKTHTIVGDSTDQQVGNEVRRLIDDAGAENAHCVILHPPYHDIIKFSADSRDLSNSATLDSFLSRFKLVVDNAINVLAPGRFLALVIGDIYTDSQLVPLGFLCAQACTERGLQFKAINVKDIQGNERGKGKNSNLWRFRALRMGFYVFKHEYVMIFRKPIPKRSKRASVSTAV